MRGWLYLRYSTVPLSLLARADELIEQPAALRERRFVQLLMSFIGAQLAARGTAAFCSGPGSMTERRSSGRN